MKIILAAAPAAGHLNPILSVARLLVDAGHDVVIISASAFKGRIVNAGFHFRALSGKADFDGTRLNDAFPERRALPPGLTQIRYDIEHVTVGAMEDQFSALKAVLQEFPAELVLADIGFVGTWPLVLGASASRPVVAGLGVTFLTLKRDDSAPVGPGLLPATDDESKAQFAAIAEQIDSAVWEPIRAAADASLARLGAQPLPMAYLDSMVLLNDVFLQPTVRGFEYPRRDMDDKVHFVGPLPMHSDVSLSPAIRAALDARKGKRVVLVTQGTLANSDLGQLVAPTLAALADRSDLIVLATTGGRPLEALQGAVPANAFLERILPFDQVMPQVDVLVTNGGYGTVTYALGAGVPLVVAGLSEDKPEVAARVTWSGAGIDLKTDCPTPEQVRDAVDALLAEPRYRDAARRLAAEADRTTQSIPDLLAHTVRRLSTR
jgi:MGT family glycosyltransferase